MKKWCLILLLFPAVASAQTYAQGGLLLDFNTTEYLRKSWHLKSKAQGRLQLERSAIYEPFVQQMETRRVDLQLLAENRISATSSFAFGAMYRVSNQQDLIRLVQQKAWVSQAHKVKWAFRLRFDQSIRESEDVQYRYRYRTGLQVPLDGHSLDNGEHYLMFNAEVLYKVWYGYGDWETRLLLSYGSVTKGGGKNEIGIDYRLDAPGQYYQEHQVWLSFAYFFKRLK